MNGLDVDIAVDRVPRVGAPFRLEIALRAADGITVLCGPSGAGKSTLLLALLGAIRPASGSIALDRRLLFHALRGIDVPIPGRRVGMVFQDSLLFPHLDALSNVAFGIPKRDGRREIALELLQRTGAGDLASRRTHELSGGQRQRVALARALAADPAALLLDEPFSALDPPGRVALGELIVALQRSSGIPFVHVTHDLGEALRIGTRLVLMAEGRLIQAGAPGEVLARPGSVAAAEAVGTENRFSGTVIRRLDGLGLTEVDLGPTRVLTGELDREPGRRIELGLRAEDILVALSAVQGTSARNVLAGTVEGSSPRGTAIELVVATPTSFRVLVSPASVRELDLVPGRRVWLLIKAAAFHRLV